MNYIEVKVPPPDPVKIPVAPSLVKSSSNFNIIHSLTLLRKKLTDRTVTEKELAKRELKSFNPSEFEKYEKENFVISDHISEGLKDFNCFLASSFSVSVLSVSFFLSRDRKSVV